MGDSSTTDRDVKVVEVTPEVTAAPEAPVAADETVRTPEVALALAEVKGAANVALDPISMRRKE